MIPPGVQIGYEQVDHEVIGPLPYIIVLQQERARTQGHLSETVSQQSVLKPQIDIKLETAVKIFCGKCRTHRLDGPR